MPDWAGDPCSIMLNALRRSPVNKNGDCGTFGERMKGMCLLVSGGEYAELPRDAEKAEYVIACDRGWQHALRMGIRPDLIVGDFDSAPIPGESGGPYSSVPRDEGGRTPSDAFKEGAAAVECSFADITVERVPTRKDDTDTMIAARRALETGYGDIVICCAFGGRLDHVMANLQTPAFLAIRGARVRLLGAETDALVYGGRTERFPRRDGWSLSVFAVSDVCEDVAISGTKYDCEKQVLRNTFPLGVSNVWTSEKAEVSVGNGIIMVMQSKLKKGEHI